jgi:FkbM family methyltransferase
MLSHAQNAEDVVLKRVFEDIETGFYVDVGASDPVNDSVTLYFYMLGWSGVNVEPAESDYERLVHARDRDVNLQVVVGTGELPLTFYPSDVRGHGTVDAALAAQRGQTDTTEVPQISLAHIFDEYAPPEGVDFLKIDVEGWEAEVVASADWLRHRPRIVVVESVDTDGRPTHDEWEPLLLAASYRLGLFDGVNRFYCRDEDAETIIPRLAAPANVRDNWRPAREVGVQDRLEAQVNAVQELLDERLGELKREQEAHQVTRRELDRERDAHEVTQRELDRQRDALEVTQREFSNVLASTSWRVTSPLRTAVRFTRMMRRGSGAARRG